MGRDLATWAAQSRTHETIAMVKAVVASPHITTVPGMTSAELKAKKRPLRDQGEGKMRFRSRVRAASGKESAMELECEHSSKVSLRESSAIDPVRKSESGQRGASSLQKQVPDQGHTACIVQPLGIACDAQPLRKAWDAQPFGNACVAQPADDACVI